MSASLSLPVRQPRLRDQVYASLREMVRFGTFPDGGAVEQDLSKQLGVSRTPVREALFQLCREGVLEDTGRGYRVPEVTREAMQEIVELRLLIEPQAAAMAVNRADAPQIAAIAEQVRGEEAAYEAGDTQAFILHNSNFRTRLLKACGNTRLAQVLETLDDQIQRIRVATLSVRENQATTLDHHRAMCAAFEQRDEAAASDSMRRLLATAKSYYESKC
ncbi:GntR family transcriptional regulator [Amorphus orientalis]|uniref:DNA-binding GntR family transcriptional regulator n=1 Tax=Amorphus orientalis TaxID=649198 RepID=A0AAE3VS74_9HYPH|nr:GntR family transcriptional regulator [Amorphus orientalis]MDQ0316840.1 DNA-binding GntR family transcriptional regulator [Amorphus orientalis]